MKINQLSLLRETEQKITKKRSKMRRDEQKTIFKKLQTYKTLNFFDSVMKFASGLYKTGNWKG